MSRSSSRSVIDHVRENACYEDEADTAALSPLLGQPENLSAIPTLSEASSHRQFEQITTDRLLLSPRLNFDPSWTSSPSLKLRSSNSITSAPADPLVTFGDTTNEPAPVIQPEANVHQSLDGVTYGSIDLLSRWFPNVDPQNPAARTWRTRRSRREVVLRTSFGIAFIIFIANLCLSLVPWTRFGLTPDGVIKLSHGDCTHIRRINTLCHVLINVVSTFLLSSSNVCLQLVVAPTRAEVDKAHAKGVWLDIGVPSFRNLRHISWKSIIVWYCLALSSIPIHFLYNSTIFTTISTNDYHYFVVYESFLEANDPWQFEYADNQTTINVHNFVVANLSTFERLSNYECLMRTSNEFAYRPTMILVNSNVEDAMRQNTSYYDSFNMRSWNGWPADLCTQSNYPEVNEIGGSARFVGFCPNLTASNETAQHWVFRTWPIDYCLAIVDPAIRQTTETCYLEYAPALLLVVSMFNGVKCVCILYVLLTFELSKLCTLGDAIASFLKTPDQYTKDLGITTKAGLLSLDGVWKNQEHVVWRPRDISWRHAVSTSRWTFTTVVTLVALLTATIFTASGLSTQTKYGWSITLPALWSLGFGTINTKELVSFGQPIDGEAGLFSNIILGNIGQLALSVFYLADNAVLSCSLVADEWNGFATERKTLRVSAPVGIQRSSYFISMPLRYGVPIVIVFAIEHWLYSQAVFIIRVIKIGMDGLDDANWTTTGYSFIPSILAITVPAFVTLLQLLNGFLRKWPATSAMPLVSTCSAAISANCHRPDKDDSAYLLPVRWGVWGRDQHGRDMCSFTTSYLVKPPEDGQEFLGIPDRQITEVSPVTRPMMKSIRDAGLWIRGLVTGDSSRARKEHGLSILQK